MEQQSEKALMLNKTPIGKGLAPRATAVNRASSSRPVSFLAEGEVYQLVEQALTMRKGEMYSLLIMVLFQGALRISEAVHLKIKDKASIDGRPVLLVMGKGNKPRIVAIPERLSFHLGDYAQRKGLKPYDRFFSISRVRGWQVIKKCADKADLEGRRVYCHLLRHSGAIARLKRTGNPKSLQIHLGHSDMKMTMRYLATMQVIESLNTEGQVEFER